ncbi:UNVERIFIED_ORG: hypothetical protein C7430_10692 [Pantoea agglomerans]|uniref:Uncharacterized protein n=1 Tax=Enterobacter agglomerans TaxID=549 RepID=A0ABD6XU99_ENTAG
MTAPFSCVCSPTVTSKPPFPANIPVCSATLCQVLCILSRLTFTFADPVIEPKVKLPPALLLVLVLVLSVTVMRFIE